MFNYSLQMRADDLLSSQNRYSIIASEQGRRREGEVDHMVPGDQGSSLQTAEQLIMNSIKNYYQANDKLKRFWEEREYDISNSFINLAIIEQEEAKQKEQGLRGKEKRGDKNDSQEYREQRISSYEEIHRAKKPIEIKELLKEAKSKKLVIYGRAGIGKTTICQYLTVAWQKEEIWQNKFKQCGRSKNWLLDIVKETIINKEANGAEDKAIEIGDDTTIIAINVREVIEKSNSLLRWSQREIVDNKLKGKEFGFV
ncbi:ATP-binding protein [Holosporaceae bacterium 'Namur']|nr:ATP-binding protein [Holosporaceae bacterium 'Namur']